MYETASDVMRDHIRACELYVRSATSRNPLSSQAILLADAIRRIGPGTRALCTKASMGDRREPTPFAPVQTTQPDAIDAFVGGDYQQAVHALKPITENWLGGEIDAVSGFFMASLYANGLGVPQDVVRACVLYLRSAMGTGPFARVNRVLSDAIVKILSSDQTTECLALSSLGFNHGFEPATFRLGPGHWVEIEMSGGRVSATVEYQGKQTQTDVPVPYAPGLTFLPIEYTELHVGGTVPGRRHFIELFAWMPIKSGSEWQLWWLLSEVVRDELVSVTGQELVTVQGNGPPAPPADLHDLVSLRVNKYGMAEWAIHAGPNAGSDAIETDVERQEVEAHQRMRKAADDRVDWKLTLDADRVPSLRYSDADGCGDLFVYGWSDNRTESIAVRADKAKLQLSTIPRTFQLSTQGDLLEISVDVFEGPRRHWNFCTDVLINDGTRRESWRAVAGVVTVQLSLPGVRAREPNKYRVTIQIDDAEFVNASGKRIRSARPIRLTAIAGPFGY
jgi:hypothetical protein